MRYLTPLVLAVFLLLSCKNDEFDEPSPSTVQIREYSFSFDSKFTKKELQGIDSYVGEINGPGITLLFDYGWYSGPLKNLPENEYEVIEDTIEGHYRQIVIPVDSRTNNTRLHMFEIPDSSQNQSMYNSLTLYTSDLSDSQQDMIVDVFTNVEISKE